MAMSAQIPQPLIDSDSRPYWEGLARGELRIQQCDNCSRHVFYPRSICPHCFSQKLSWITAAGRGTIYSYTVVHQAYGAFADIVPFVIAIVELEEKVRMMTRIVNTPREEIAIGKPVRITFHKISDEVTLPYFQLAE
jgi:uncharacterized OB-fold protein